MPITPLSLLAVYVFLWFLYLFFFVSHLIFNHRAVERMAVVVTYFLFSLRCYIVSFGMRVGVVFVVSASK